MFRNNSKHSRIKELVLTPRQHVCRLLIAISLGSLTGCSNRTSSGSSGAATASPASDLNGNWSFVATPVSGSGSYAIQGSIVEQLSGGDSDFTTSVLAVGNSCFSNAPTTPLDGSVSGPLLQLSSFTVDGEMLLLNATSNLSSDGLTGTYSLLGPCSNGEHGQITGTLFKPFSGHYSTDTTTSSPQLALALEQETNPTGKGTYLLSGTANTSGISCFSGGMILSELSFVQGSVVHIAILTNETPQSTITLSGNGISSADRFGVSRMTIDSGRCAGALAPATFTKQ